MGGGFSAGASFQLFLGGPKFFLYFSMPPDYWKIGKKQYFICSNLTLFIVPFFLFSRVFLSLFSFFLSDFFFFLFSFSLGGGGDGLPAPPNDASDSAMYFWLFLTKTVWVNDNFGALETPEGVTPPPPPTNRSSDLTLTLITQPIDKSAVEQRVSSVLWDRMKYVLPMVKWTWLLLWIHA